MLGRTGCMSPQVIMSSDGFMVRHIGVHRADDAEVIGTFADLRKDLADGQPRLPAAIELERRTS